MLSFIFYIFSSKAVLFDTKVNAYTVDKLPENLSRQEIADLRVPQNQREMWIKQHYRTSSSTRFGNCFLDKLKEVGNDYPSLIGDIGLMKNLDSFILFIKKEENRLNRESHFLSSLARFADPLGITSAEDLYFEKKLPAKEARERYLQQEPKKTVLRALALTKEEHDKIRKEGMKSNYVRFPKEKLPMVSAMSNITLRVNGMSEARDPFLSVTSSIEAALMASSPYITKDKDLYLFFVTLPKSQIIEIRKDDYSNPKPFSVFGRLYSPKIESFVPYMIRPEEIDFSLPVKGLPEDTDVDFSMQ